jgi:hypothetical protein
MNKINCGVGVLTRPNGQDARPTEWVINFVQLLSDPDLSGVFMANQLFEVNRVVLDASRRPAQQIGPRSRILLR